MPSILGIETSCDETAVAVVEDGRVVRSSLVSSQVALHAPFGGIVPEYASRHHLEMLHPLVCEALAQAGVERAAIDAVAVTCGPGLAGALLVGVAYAKALAVAWQRPLIAVNHLEGHLYAPWLDESDVHFPHIALLVSGGHSSLYRVDGWGLYRTLGQTRDDAVGEAYDKVAKFLGLGYPGGPILDRLAAEQEEIAFTLPRPMLQDEGYDFSFSGLKTAVVTAVQSANEQGRHPPVRAVARAFQEAAVDVLVEKALRAALAHRCAMITLTGGVAANARLRERIKQAGEQHGIAVRIPPPVRCTDNAAMIAGIGYHHWIADHTAPADLGATARLPLVSWRKEDP